MSRLVLAFLISVCSACVAPVDGLTENERATVSAMAQPPAPATDLSNAVLGKGAQAVTLGQKLFFDPDISGPLLVSQAGQPNALPGADGKPGQVGAAGLISCADCHSPNRYFSDDRSSPNNVSLGAKWTTRNSPPLVDVAFYQVGPGSSWFAWDGRSDSLWMQCDVAYEAGAAMNGNALRLAGRLQQDVYLDAYNALFPEAPLSKQPFAALPDGGVPPRGTPERDELDRVTANASKVLAAYITALVTGPSPFDRFARGDESALSEQQLRGLKLFLGKAGCIECHTGSGFTDLSFHNTGLPQSGQQVPEGDTGRSGGLKSLADSPFNLKGPFSDLPFAAPAYPPAPTTADLGAFRTKSLRNVAQTGPYMHAGQLATLADVVRFYNMGGGAAGFSGTKSILMQPLGLTDDEVDDLVSFLESLTGTPPPANLLCDNAPHEPGFKPRFTVCGAN